MTLIQRSLWILGLFAVAVCYSQWHVPLLAQADVAQLPGYTVAHDDEECGDSDGDGECDSNSSDD